MISQPKIFFNTSALFASLWSEAGGARLLLKLGEARAIQLWVSSQVLDEIEAVIRRKMPNMLGVLTIILDSSNISIVQEVESSLFLTSQQFVPYIPDAYILAAAWTEKVDYFVTLDRQHFLTNKPLLQHLPFLLGTPGDCLAWYRKQISQ